MNRAGNGMGIRWWPLLLLIPLGGAAAGWAGWFAPADRMLQRWFYQWRGELESPARIIYVDVDAEATRAFGGQPWNRAVFAALAEVLLDQGGARAVAFDFVFSEYGHPAARAGNAELRRVGDRFPGRLIHAATYSTGLGAVSGERRFPFRFEGAVDPDEGDLPEMAEFAVAGFHSKIGLIDVIEKDGMPREAPLFARARGLTYWHFALHLAMSHWGAEPQGLRLSPDYQYLDVHDDGGRLLQRIPLRREQLVTINWHHRWDSPLNNRHSAAEVAYHAARLESDDPEERKEARRFFDLFAEAIVLIGPVDPLLGDRAPSPFDHDAPVPKVGAHGNLAMTLISGRFLSEHPPLSQAWLTFAFAVALIPLLVMERRGQIAGKAAALVLLTGFVGVAWYFFAHRLTVIPVGGPVLTGTATAVAALAFQAGAAVRQKKRVRDLFGAYLAPEVVRQMVDERREPKLGGEEVVVTALFSDVEKFSTFSEMMPAGDLVTLMNEYLSVMTAALHEEGGTLDKYIGDAVMAFFGAPLPREDHAARACRAAVAMRAAQRRLCESWKQGKRSWPERVLRMRTRIGINTGLVVVGNMGSALRFNYTISGDEVNLASRCEGAAKEYGVGTLVTGATKTEADKANSGCVFRELDEIVVVGRSRPSRVYELVGLEEELTGEGRRCLDWFAEGRECYLRRDWKAALRCFEHSAGLEEEREPGRLNPSLVYLERCRRFAENPPPADWSGVHTLAGK